jgi:hypothetical protein
MQQKDWYLILLPLIVPVMRLLVVLDLLDCSESPKVIQQQW